MSDHCLPVGLRIMVVLAFAVFAICTPIQIYCWFMQPIWEWEMYERIRKHDESLAAKEQNDE